jgi:hypothetical protein
VTTLDRARVVAFARRQVERTPPGGLVKLTREEVAALVEAAQPEPKAPEQGR